MLRNLSVLLIAGLLLVTAASAAPQIEETAVITTDPAGWFNAESVRYGYDEGWQYSNGGEWTPVEDQLSLTTRQKQIAQALIERTQAEGYRLFENTRENPVVTELQMPPQQILDRVYEEEQQELEAQTQEQTGTTPTNTDNQDTQPLPSINTGECGVNRDYIKFCYYQNSIHPYNPLKDEQAINDFVRAAVSQNRVEQGFILVTYAPEDREQADSQKQRVRIAREQALKSTTDATLAGLTTGDAMRVVSGSYAKQAPGDDPRAAFLIPDTAVERALPSAVINEIPSLSNPAQPQLSAVASNQSTIEQAWQAQWQNTVSEFTQDPQLNELAKQVYQQTGITVYLVANNHQWELSDREALNVQLQEQIFAGQSNIGSPHTTFFGSTLDVANQLADSAGHPRACAVYLLLSPDGVDVYQSSYCHLRIYRRLQPRSDPNEHAAQMLQSALRNTDRLEPERMFLTAYSLAEQATTLRPGRSEAEALAQWAATTDTFDERDQEQRTASQEIVLAREALTENNPQLALTKATTHTPSAYSRMRPLGAETAVQAAAELRDCEQLADTTDRMSEYLRRGTSAYSRALQALDECQYQRVRTQCEPVLQGRNVNDVPTLEILFIRDGIDNQTFNAYTEEIARGILDTPNLWDHTQEIGFRRAPSVGALTETRGHLKAPSINHRLIHETARACYGDTIIVLSDEHYLPVTAGGNGFVSADACGDSASCMQLYATRTLGLGVFELEYEERTFTAPLRLNRWTDTITYKFSERQQEQISEYFGGNR